MSTTYRPTCSIFVEVTHSGIINGNEPHNCGEDFWIARTRGEFFPQAYFDRLTLDDAYRIQIALIDRRVAAGKRCESEEPKRGSGDCVDDPAVDPQGGACRCGRLRRRGVDRHVGGPAAKPHRCGLFACAVSDQPVRRIMAATCTCSHRRSFCSSCKLLGTPSIVKSAGLRAGENPQAEPA